MKKLAGMWQLFTANRKLVLITLIFWCVTIFVLSSVPGNRYPKVDFPLADKLMHMQLYFWGGLLAAAYFRRMSYLVAIGFVAFYGFTDEVHQLFVANRSFSFQDWLADLLGGSIGVTLSRQLINYAPLHLQPATQEFDSQIMES